jgi:parallel beta helix pectate lyase-like protein
VWGYGPSPSSGNQIVGNHIHDLGQGLLNDMGGVYLLGVAPGTVVRGNLIHDVSCANYGGWGIYLDEGSSHVVVEGNVCHDLSSQCFHVHYGRENLVRHNVFAYGRQGGIAVTRPEEHVAFTFERNIVLCDGGVPAFSGVPGKGDVRAYGLVSDLNVFWDLGGPVRVAGNGKKDADMRWSVVELLDDDWRALGHDRHSVVADPLFADAAGRDFGLPADSPAFGVGFVAPDVSTAGPRPDAGRPHPLARSVHSLGVRPSTTSVR